MLENTLDYVIAPPNQATLPVYGTDALFPINRVFCIGRNYAAHAVEMGHDPDREPPFFFLKSPGNVTSDGRFPYPPISKDVHHEVEMVAALAQGGSDIAVADALACVFGYGIGLDMTRRDLQGEAKKMGRPWEVGKAFEASAPCGPLHRVDDVGHLESGEITLSINGETQQEGDLNQMIWKVPEMIAILSQYFVLQPGDIIMTGTPAGVGPVSCRDHMVARVEKLGELTVDVV